MQDAILAPASGMPAHVQASAIGDVALSQVQMPICLSAYIPVFVIEWTLAGSKACPPKLKACAWKQPTQHTTLSGFLPNRLPPNSTCRNV